MSKQKKTKNSLGEEEVPACAGKSNVEIVSKTYVDEIGNLFFDVSMKNGDMLIEKRLSVEDYLGLFEEYTTEQEEFRELPRLPEEILKARVSNMDESTFNAVVEYPAGKRAFSYMGEHMLLAFPAIISFIKVEKGVRTDTHVFCIKQEDIGKEKPILYYYPFGNVSSDGSCCYGNISVSGVKDVCAAPSVLDQFLLGETNNDLWGSKFTNSGAKTQGELIEKLRKMEDFPEEWLSKSTCQVSAQYKKLGW